MGLNWAGKQEYTKQQAGWADHQSFKLDLIIDGDVLLSDREGTLSL